HQSRAQEGDALFAWKRHHQKAYKAVKPSCHTPIAQPGAWRTRAHCSAAGDAAHGRLGRRRVWTMTDCAARPALAPGSARRPVVVVETRRPAHAGASPTSP